VHTYGGGHSAQPQGGPGVWLESDGNQCDDLYCETGPSGLYIQGNQNVVNGLHTKVCSVNDVWIGGGYNDITGFWIEADVLGFYISGQDNTVRGGKVDFRANNVKGVRYTNGTRQRCVDVKFIIPTNLTGCNAIDADVTLNRCFINIDVWGGGSGTVAVDLKEDDGTNRLGTGNIIYVTTDQFTGTAFDLATGADKVNNFLYINGVRQQ
jgi:hypothetical protein